MTAVEWLEKELNEKGKLTPVDFYQAKEMEKQQMLDCYLKSDVFPRKYEFEKYYNETYGSKGSGKLVWCDDDCIQCEQEATSSKTEISDEEIENCVGDGMHDFYKGGFIEGAKWYREQLKNKIK